SDDAREDEGEEDEGGEQEEGDYREANLFLPADGGRALRLRDQLRVAQRADDGLVEQQRGGHVHAALDEVEGQEHGHEHVGDGGAGHALVNRGDKVVPEQHQGGHDYHAEGEADD